MITKVVISAAGQGTRMKDLSLDRPKHLIEVKGRPFLAYLLDNVMEAGYKEIILVVGYKQEMMESFLKNYRYKKGFFAKKPKVTLVSQFEILGPKEKIYGTACPLMCVKDLVEDKPFVSLVGDNIYSIRDLAAMNIDDNFCYVAGLKHAEPEKFGVLIESKGTFSAGDNFLQEIIEKPTEFVGDLINTSLYKFTKDVFEKLPLIEKSVRGEYEITDVISLLAKEGKVKIKKIQDNWMDFGRPEDIETFSEKFLHGSN